MKLQHQYHIHKAQYNYNFFKSNEKVFNLRLKIGSYYIIRFDGKGMTRAFRKDRDLFFEVMRATFYNFCADSFVQDYFREIPFAYSFSDEVSLLFQHYDDRNRTQKILTLMTSKMTLVFYKTAHELGLDLCDKDWLFDARILKVQGHEIENYFIVRQSFAICGYIMGLCEQLGIGFVSTSKTLQIARDFGKHIIKEHLLGLIYAQEKSEIFEFCADVERLRKLIGIA
ncbi:MAG: tRNA(His) guanylyltransferase Thg1 family protein [Helicobacter sp.]|nr:tRNA(His) guanylyltransferase Thg1 family protein [Helicobacter sp.]